MGMLIAHTLNWVTLITKVLLNEPDDYYNKMASDTADKWKLWFRPLMSGKITKSSLI